MGTKISNVFVDGVVPGCVQFYANATAPAGWLECDGASLLRASYPALFTAIGTTYGSVDGTHFNLPDLRGEFIRCWDHGKGTDVGRAIASSQGHAFTNHTHLSTSVSAGSSGQLGGFLNGADTTGQATTGANTGSGTETRPRNVALMACIKY